MFAIFSGIFQFAYSFYVYNTLVVAVRQGARYASIKPYDSTSTTPTSGFQNAVRNMVVYGDPNPPGGARPAVPHLLASNVTLFVTGGGAGTLTVPMQITSQLPASASTPSSELGI